MRKTSLPTALVYGWNRFGRYELESDVYWEENLIEKVVIHSYRTDKNVKVHLSKHKPDIILVFGEIPTINNYVGNAIIIAAGLYIVMREMKLKKNIVTSTARHPTIPIKKD